MLEEEDEKHNVKVAAIQQSFKEMRTQAEEKLTTIETQIRGDKETHEAAQLEIHGFQKQNV